MGWGRPRAWVGVASYLSFGDTETLLWGRSSFEHVDHVTSLSLPSLSEQGGMTRVCRPVKTGRCDSNTQPDRLLQRCESSGQVGTSFLCSEETQRDSHCLQFSVSEPHCATTQSKQGFEHESASLSTQGDVTPTPSLTASLKIQCRLGQTFCAMKRGTAIAPIF